MKVTDSLKLIFADTSGLRAFAASGDAHVILCWNEPLSGVFISFQCGLQALRKRPEVLWDGAQALIIGTSHTLNVERFQPAKEGGRECSEIRGSYMDSR